MGILLLVVVPHPWPLPLADRYFPLIATTSCTLDARRPGWSLTFDTPRMRGEQSCSSTVLPPPFGSPPHARGAGRHQHDRVRVQGITPACAGSSGPGPRRRRSPTDHPRMRGEQDGQAGDADTGVGSPPHARGAVVETLPMDWSGRITPACAGSSGTASGLLVCVRDHPRMRGEQVTASAGGVTHLGSPPHARGAGTASSPRSARRWITPACAGNRSVSARPVR